MFSKAKSFVALSFVALATLIGCMKTDTLHVHVFTCPMHPEITGKEGDKCAKCGMALTHKD